MFGLLSFILFTLFTNGIWGLLNVKLFYFSVHKENYVFIYQIVYLNTLIYNKIFFLNLIAENNQRHLHLIIVSSQQIQKLQILRHKILCLIQLVVTFWIMHSKDIMHAFLHTARQVK